MKMTINHPFIQMEKEELQQLCAEVKESLATETGIKTIRRNRFGVADLWRIQKNTRYRVQRRNLM